MPDDQHAGPPARRDSPFAETDRARPALLPALMVALSIAAIAGMALWLLAWPEPLLVQGEADATRIDIAARIDGRVQHRPVGRGQDVAAGAVLFGIENPALLARLAEAEAARRVAAADLARILAGTRAETVAERRAAVAAAEASLRLALQNHARIRQLAERDVASLQRLDEATAQLSVARQTLERAELALREAVAGYTAEERGVAQAGLARAEAAVATLAAQVAELTVRAPAAAQVYQIRAEPGEYVAPGVPLLSLVDLSDVWLRFALREDLLRGLAQGDRFTVRIPALGDRPVEVAVSLVAPRGDYAAWRATRATGDFDRRSFEVRARPVQPLPGLRPGMSAYAEWSR
jgi:HlyD family secretion protein